MSSLKATAIRRTDREGENRRSDAASNDRAARTAFFISAGLLFLSGTASLIYQILWTKQLALIVGIEVYSITVAVSSFFAGLALGGVIFGHWADQLRRP